MMSVTIVAAATAAVRARRPSECWYVKVVFGILNAFGSAVGGSIAVGVSVTGASIASAGYLGVEVARGVWLMVILFVLGIHISV